MVVEVWEGAGEEASRREGMGGREEKRKDGRT
jgi:hypothetical protein